MRRLNYWSNGFGIGLGSNNRSITYLVEGEILRRQKNGALKQYWSNRRVEQEVGRSDKAARVQTAITVNRTTARVLHWVERNAVDRLDKFDDYISQAPNFKKRKRSTTNGGSTLTTTEASGEPDLSSRKEPAFEGPNNQSLVQAHAAETEFDESELGSSTRGRVRSEASWSSLTGASSVSGSSKSISDSTMCAGGNDNSRSTSASSGSPGQPTHEPEFPDPTLNLEYFATLNQPVKWTVEDVNLVQKFQEFRAENLHDFSLARDGVADLSVGSKFRKSLAPDIGKAASKFGLVGELQATWPTLTGILGRVFAKNHYDDVAEAITDESMKDPVARYIMSVISSYSHLWKNLEKDDLTEAKQPRQYAGGVAVWGNSQIFLSEASTIHSPKAEKLRRDELKLARAMRDSWVSRFRVACEHLTTLSGIALFGSSTFKDETSSGDLTFVAFFGLVVVESGSL
ncbi:hypothetical protein BGX30_000231 [Mortierella sp. GBA39]|nr:hypothetical protein BGX30_000231 [Mortierella sp. GBA39]